MFLFFSSYCIKAVRYLGESLNKSTLAGSLSNLNMKLVSFSSSCICNISSHKGGPGPYLFKLEWKLFSFVSFGPSFWISWSFLRKNCYAYSSIKRKTKFIRIVQFDSLKSDNFDANCLIKIIIWLLLRICSKIYCRNAMLKSINSNIIMSSFGQEKCISKSDSKSVFKQYI